MRKQILLIFVLFAVISANAQSSGGTFDMTNSVTASGGGTSSGGTFNLDGTAGQTAVGTFMNTSPYNLQSGFWQPMFVPTAASVSISGRILAPNGGGLVNAIVTLNGGTLTQPIVARSSSFGYFSFEGVEVGQTYIVTVSSKRFGFAQPNQIIAPFEDISDIIFQANWEN